jgi:hypothetical protein
MKLIQRYFSVATLLTFLAVSVSAQQTTKGVHNVLSATFTSASGTAYTSGDSVGTVQVLTNVTSAAGMIVKLTGITLLDSAGQNAHLKFFFFNGTAPTLTDNAAFAFGSSFTNLVGILDIDPADYTTADSKGVLSRSLLDLWMRLSSTSSNLSVACVTTGTPTYGNGGTVTVNFTFEY